MQEGILIVDEDKDCRKQMAEMFTEAGYEVTVSDSVASALYGVLKNTAQVVVLGSRFDELTAGDIIPLLKRCNRKLPIILITADNTSLGLLRKLRCEGVFYHALKPVDAEDREEIRQAVHCAFENLRIHPA
jgi:DNA-binding NtrC family response regulator